MATASSHGRGLPRTVEVRGVNYAYGSGNARRQVLFNNDLDLHAGEIVALTGPSGSGKTTLLTLIGGLRTLQEGLIQVCDHHLEELSRSALQRLRRHIGFIFQEHNLFEAMSARQTLRLAMQLFRERYSRLQMEEWPLAMLEELELNTQADSRPGSLSTGQKQRVAIGRALINHPRLILADEPTAALDRVATERVMHLLRDRTHKEGATVLMVTHDPRLYEVADRTVSMVDGRIAGGDG